MARKRSDAAGNATPTVAFDATKEAPGSSTRREESLTAIPGEHTRGPGEKPVRKLGERLRALRNERGWTLDELSERSGVSRSTLSKIERAEASPTYDVIQRLAHGFQLDVPEFFGPGPRRASATGRRAVSRVSEEQVHEGRGYLYRPICAELSTKKMIPFHATILAKTLEDAGGYTRHAGEECLYVLSGQVEFHTEHYAPVVLNPGDAIYIDSKMGHACTSLGPKPAEVFWVTVDED